MTRNVIFVIAIMSLVSLSGWGGEPKKISSDVNRNGGEDMSFKITSSAFAEGSVIPKKHTGDGADLSPQLSWTNAPAATRAFVIINDDPDAPGGDWVHWLIYDIPPSMNQLAEGMPKDKTVLGTAKQGRNGFGELGYDGPAPPRGKPHRYFFKLYALSRETGLPYGATKAQLLKAMEGSILGETKLMGTYQR